MKMIDKFAALRKENPDKFEATKFIQERIDLYFRENSINIVRSDTEHNETSRILSGHLITYATVVIGLTSLLFSKGILQPMNNWQKGFLLAGLVTMFVSLLAGCWELWNAMQHYKKIASLFSEASIKAPVTKVESVSELHEFRGNLFKDESKTSKSIGLLTQVLALTIGSVLYLILFITVLFAA